MVAELIFYLASGLVVYHHLGYPLLIRGILTLRAWEPSATQRDDKYRPTVSIIVPAHNEAAVIENKVRNLAALRYPEKLITVVIALDGCSDTTQALAEAALRDAPSQRIVLHEYQPNIGKVAVLNDQITRSQSEIVALTDASAMIDSEAIIRAVAHFADPVVGVVTGCYRVTDANHRGETMYWHYQSDLRAAESALAGPIGAHGAFYLFRRSAWTPLAPDTINDDFILPMSIVLQGLRAVFDSTVIATEIEHSKPRQEFRRRVRIGAGNLQQVVRLARIADPRRGWVAFAFASGKGLRGILPFLLLAVLGSSASLAARGSVPFILLVILEVACVCFAIFGSRIPKIRKIPLLASLLYVLEGYLALTVGAIFVIFRREGKVWRLSKVSDRGT